MQSHSVRVLQTVALILLLGATGSAQASWPPTNVLGPATGFGESLAILGDVDGDGFDDLLVGEPKPYSTTGTPRVTLYSGASGQPIHVINGAVGTSFGGLVAAVGDVDADGVPDFVVRQDDVQQGSTPSQGFVRIFSGATATLVRQHAGPDYFLAAVTRVDDIDADGHDDYAIGRQQVTSGNGIVEIHSGATGAVLRSWSRSTSDGFGAALARVDDLDGDGLADLAVGKPADQTSGAAYPNSGAVEILSSSSGVVLAAFSDPNGASVRLGDGLQPIGDLDGDGIDDLLVSATGLLGFLPFGSGRVLAFSTGTGAVIHDISPLDTVTGLGFALAAGDFDLDGTDDIVFSSPKRAGGEGRVYIYSGANGRRLSALDGSAPTAGFGQALAAGDLNGDGIVDLCIAEAHSGGQVAGLGGVVSIHSAPAPHIPDGVDTVQSAVLGGTTGSGHLAQHGDSVASMGDVDGDGISDFAVSSPGEGGPYVMNPVAGRIDLYSGADQSLLNTIQGTVGQFGEQLAGAGDVDGDGLADVAFTVVPPSTNSPSTQPTTIRAHSGAGGGQIYSVTVPVDRNIPFMMGAGNLDGAGGDDLLYIAYHTNPYASSLAALSSSGSEIWSVVLPAGSFFGYGLLMVPDQDGDGIEDIKATVFPNGLSGELVTLSGATGAPIATVPLGWTMPSALYHPIVSVGDINGDGADDYALGAEAILIGGPSRLDVVSGATGAALYRVVDPLGSSGFGRYVERLGDLDGDGVDELAVSSFSHVTVLSGVDGRIAMIHALPANAPWNPRVGGFARIPDIDGDGRPELAIGFSDRPATPAQFFGAVDYVSFSPVAVNPLQGGTPVPGAELIAEARGTVGAGEGGPYAVLAVNDTAGGVDRVVEVGIGEPIEFRMKQSPARTAAPQNFALFGLVGVPMAADAIPIPTVGTLLFTPSPAMPGAPWLFTLAETYLTPSIGFLPAAAGDWRFLVPAGLPFATEFTLQGICDDTTPGDTAATNALVVRVM